MRNRLDMDMLAVDIAGLLSSDEYEIDVDSNDVMTALPEFVAAMRRCVRAHQKTDE